MRRLKVQSIDIFKNTNSTRTDLPEKLTITYVNDSDAILKEIIDQLGMENLEFHENIIEDDITVTIKEYCDMRMILSNSYILGNKGDLTCKRTLIIMEYLEKLGDNIYFNIDDGNEIKKITINEIHLMNKLIKGGNQHERIHIVDDYENMVINLNKEAENDKIVIGLEYNIKEEK